MENLALQKTLAGPWRRFFARNFDLYLEIMILALILNPILSKYSAGYTSILNMPNNDYVMGMIYVPIALIVDAIICKIFGNSLGKHLLNLKVEKIKGQMDAGDWFRRALGLWVRGYGLAFPLVSLFTFWNQYSRVKDLKQASYDEKIDCQVYATPLSKGRMVLAIVAIVTMYVVVIGLSAIGKQDEQQISKAISAPPYVWQNPYTKIDASISAIWKHSATKNSDQQSIYTFTEVTQHAVAILGLESAEITLNSYANAFVSASKKTMKFNDGGKYSTKDGFESWDVYGAMTEFPDSRLHVSVRKEGPNFWRVVTIQDKPYAYTDAEVEKLSNELWKTTTAIAGK
jgi:RDD family